MNYITDTLKFMQVNKCNNTNINNNNKLYKQLCSELKLFGYVFIYNYTILELFKEWVLLNKGVITEYDGYWLVEKYKKGSDQL